MKHSERNELTRQQIKNAFIGLINSKGFNNLTVSDITREAGISRGTFYVHYTDKFELLTSIEDNLYRNIVAAIEENFDATVQPVTEQTLAEISRSPYTIFNKALDYVDSERLTIRALLSENGHPQFFDRIKEVIDDTFTKNMKKHHGYFSDTLPIDYTKEIVLNSVLNIVRHWLNKSDPETPRELSAILMKSRFLSPHELMIFPQDDEN